MGMMKQEAIKLAERLMKLDRVPPKNRAGALPAYFQDACRLIEAGPSPKVFCPVCGPTVAAQTDQGVQVCKYCGEGV